MTGPAPLPATQLLVFRFGPGADFEGRLVGALERIESGGSLRVLDALFVARDAETGEVTAVDLKGDAGGLVAPLLEFRLDPAARRRATERAFDSRASADDAQVARQLAKGLEPGAAVAALLVEHRWVRALDDAVSRTGGSPLASHFVDATALADLVPALLAAVQRPGRLDDTS